MGREKLHSPKGIRQAENGPALFLAAASKRVGQRGAEPQRS